MITLVISVIAACGLPGETTLPALGGLDPVRLCDGRETPGIDGLQSKHGRYVYRFADERSRARFLSDPERFAIQWGGGCARMGPLSGAGDQDRWTVHGGRIYIFASDGCRKGFLATPERFVVAPAGRPASTRAATNAGSAWIERAVAAHGGAASIDSAGTLRYALDKGADGWTRHLEHVVARGGRLERHDVWTPDDGDAEGFETRYVVADQVSLIEDRDRIDVTSPEQVADLHRIAQREPIVLLWARASNGFLALHTGQGELAGEPVEELLVRSQGLTTTLQLDTETGQILGMSWRGRATDGVTRQVGETFTDWQTVSGVLIPTARTVTVDGEPAPSIAMAWDAVRAE